jgi:hypothetical protein
MEGAKQLDGQRPVRVVGNDVAEMASTCVLMRTRLISRVITGIHDEKLRPFGIGSAQFAMLVMIYQIEPATRAKIGRSQHQDRSTLTRNLKVILAEGLAGGNPGVSVEAPLRADLESGLTQHSPR